MKSVFICLIVDEKFIVPFFTHMKKSVKGCEF